MEDQQLLHCVHDEYSRLTENELSNLGIVLGAYRSFRGSRRSHIAYVGMPITTGERYYTVLKEQGVKNQAELIAKLGSNSLWELIIKPNIEEGIAFADTLGSHKNLLFIAPSVFEAKKWRWSQDAYISLWYRVLGELAGSHYVMNGWEYSSGGVKEVLFSMFMQWAIIRPFTKSVAIETFGLKNFHPGMTLEQERAEYEAMRKMRVYSSSGKEITIDIALFKIVDAIFDLKQYGFQCDDLLDAAWKLKQIPVLSPLSCDPVSWSYAPYNPMTQEFKFARDKLELLVAN